jgi:anthranilate synthase/aminodeoxychorismate synthase-like glutamine amidotransferase
MILIIDNYDSFTYNLVQYLGELRGELGGEQGAELVVRRNDQVTLEEVERLDPAAIVISPGPGTPRDAGVSVEVIRRMAGRTPILGVCLGHQAIGEVFGGVVGRAPEPIHGKTFAIHHDGSGVFAGLPSPFEATRYHSLIVRREGLPDCLVVTAWTEDGLIMGLRHREAAVEGVQFHPESILTTAGKRLLANFLRSAGLAVSEAVLAAAPDVLPIGQAAGTRIAGPRG